MMHLMKRLGARVENGRFVIDELHVADQGDDLEDEERAKLHDALDRTNSPEPVLTIDHIPAHRALRDGSKSASNVVTR
jgi:hypothetical protein